MTFKLDSGALGKRMTLTGAWRPEFTDEARRHGVVELELNYAHGWKCDDLRFLQALPFLRALDITDWNIEDVSPIHELHSLISLNVNTYCKTAIDFTAFPSLENVGLVWRAKAMSLFDSRSLRRVFLSRYSGADLTSLLAMPSLRNLNLKATGIKSIGGVEESALESLEIHGARGLTSLDGVERLTHLCFLAVNDCGRVSDIDPVRRLTGLERLHLCDDRDIASLEPLAAHRKLRELLCYGTTSIVDGRISVLRPLVLQKVVFQDRRHYDMRCADFRQPTA